MPRSAVDAAKRKKGRHVTKQPPFPVPLATATREPPSDQSWFYYTGSLQGSSIVVRHSGDMDFLHKMGFFGKGTLSRSEPSFLDRRLKMNITNSGNTECLPVMDKRTYLAHKRYKATVDSNVPELNDITYHEDQQHYMDEFTDDEEEDEFDDDDDDEDDSGEIRQDLMLLTNLADLPVPRLVTLLNHVSVLSSENIASFIEVPYSLGELSTKFKVLRKMELNYFNQLYAINFPGRNFKEGEVIDLDEDDKPGKHDDDAVMILSSDEEDGETGKGEAEKSKMDVKKGENNKEKNGWSDDDDGDTEFWGTDEAKAKAVKDTKDDKDKDTQEEGKALDTLSKFSEKKLGVEGQSEIISTTNAVKESNSKVDNSKKPENTITSGSETNTDLGNDSKSDEKEPETPSRKSPEKKSPKKLSTSESDDKLSSSIEQNNEGKTEPSVIHKDECGSKSKPVGEEDDKQNAISGPKEMKLTFCSEISPEKPSSKKEETNHKEDSNDSDDVICIESESAEPKKLHRLLSTSTSQENSGKAVDTRSVNFMSCIASEPTFVTARVGFHTWGQLVHFNYSGDPSHLPTAMSVMASDKARAEGVECPAVYERVFPAVKSLLPNPNSEGAVIKQRLKPLPCLNTAKMLLINDGPSTSGYKKTTIVSALSASNLGTSGLQPPSSLSSSSSTNKLGQLPNGASTSKGSSSTLLEKALTATAISSPGTAPNNSPTSSDQKARADVSKSELTEEVLKVYLFAFGVSLSCEEDKTNIDKVTNVSSKEKLTILESILKKVESASEADRDGLFMSFCGKLDDYLSHEKVSYQKETAILRCVCSKQTVTGISGAIFSQIHEMLSPFQRSLLKRRLELRSESEKSQPSKETIGVTDVDAEMVDHISEKGSENGTDSEKSRVSVQGKSVDDMNEDFSLKRKAGKDSSYSEDNSKRAKTDSENKLCVVDKSSVVKEITNSVKANGAPDNHCTDKTSSENSESKKSGSEISKELSGDKQINSESLLQAKSKDNPDDKTSNSNKPEKSDSEKSVAENNDPKKPVSKSLSTKELSSSEVMECDDGEGSAKVKVDLVTVDLDGEDDLDLVGSKQKSKPKSPAKGGSKDNQITIGSSSEESDDDDDKSDDRDDDDDDDDERDDDNDDDESEEEECNFLPNGRRMLAQKRVRYNPLSAKDDSGHDHLVVGNSSDDDSDSDERQSKLRSPSKAKWRPCLKKDPCPVKEDLRLTLEEAYFLSFGLGCLRIFDADKALLNLKETWVTFCTLKDQFVPHYVAYHYLRAKGWVPKSGLKFGADFILYKEGPPFYHGSYSVLVVPVKGDTLKACCRGDGMTFDPRSLSWVNMAGLSRITEHVAKELLICYVLYPADLSQDEMMSPACVGRFTVKEVVVSRWVSSKERTDTNIEEFP